MKRSRAISRRESGLTLASLMIIIFPTSTFRFLVSGESTMSSWTFRNHRSPRYGKRVQGVPLTFDRVK